MNQDRSQIRVSSIKRKDGTASRRHYAEEEFLGFCFVVYCALLLFGFAF
jgi:hypothetical protein